MADLKSRAVSRSAVLNFDPRELKTRPGWNCRDWDDPANLEHVEKLSASITEEGVKQPLTVVGIGPDIFITDGECRYRAVMLAISRGVEIVSIPCIPEPRHADEADQVFSQVLRNLSKNPSPMELGNAYKKLITFGWTVARIAAGSGLSVAHVNQCLTLLSAPIEAQALISSGEVSATLAASVLRESGPADGVAKLKKAVAKAKADGKKKATAKHIEAEPESVPLPIPDPEGVRPLSAHVVAALRRIAALPGSTNVRVAIYIAQEALGIAEPDPVTIETGVTA